MIDIIIIIFTITIIIIIILTHLIAMIDIIINARLLFCQGSYLEFLKPQTFAFYGTKELVGKVLPTKI